MNEELKLLEIAKLIASLLMPMVILILGIMINRKLEKVKANYIKEKDWQNWWAAKFLDTANDYNNTVSEIVVGLHQMERISSEQIDGWEVEFAQATRNIRQSMRLLEKFEWEIKIYQFIEERKKPKVIEKEERLFNLLQNLIANRQGDLDEIREAQIEFSKEVKKTHAKILSLTPTNATRF